MSRIFGICSIMTGHWARQAPQVVQDQMDSGSMLPSSGPISGTGALLKLGLNTLALTGSNTYAGPTKVGAGTLVCSNALSLGGGALDITSGAKLQLSYAQTPTGGTCEKACHMRKSYDNRPLQADREQR